MQVSHECERIVCRWALRISWRAVIVTFLCFVIFLYMMFTMVNDRYIHHLTWYEQPAPCVTPKFIMDRMIELTFAVSNLLTKLNISHVICYGTLWGALRNGKILPWDNNVHFCLLKNDIQKVPWHTLQENFRASNLDLSYDVRHGEYIVTQGPAQAILSVFYLTPYDEIFQDGFEHRLMWFFQDNPVSFPSRLIESPFNTVLFHGQPLPVPHDGIEILKYLYKDDWWLVKPPPGCPERAR
uniref:LicD/FKTN/FKRP nucleotidyltransferase domain-containing protein n=1 Tax=Arion vulgaris TaxID=1028688 RepID=A0A0B6Y8J1_9EUPU